MDYKQILRNKPTLSEAKPSILNFFESNKTMYIGYNNSTELPTVEFVEYRYFKSEHIMMLTPASIFLNVFETGTAFSGFICEGQGLKMSKKLYAEFVCEEIPANESILEELAVDDMLVKKMVTHGAKFFKVRMQKAKLVLNPAEVYDLDEKLTPSFAKNTPSGKERFEHSRHVLMTYLDREVIFNVVVENGIYYTLTRSDSNKMEYIKKGGVCKIFDGKDTKFSTTMELLEDTSEIFEKLKSTNNAFFKENKGITALRFSKN